MATPKSSTRIGEAERTAAQRALQQHQAAGRLPIAEYAERSAAAAEAVTASEIKALFTDLPRPHPQLPGSSGGLRRNLTIAAVAAVVVLIGVLALTANRSGPTPPPVALPTPTAAPVVPVLPTSELSATPTGGADPSADPSAGGTVGPPPGNVTVRRTTGGAAITLRPSYGVDLDDDTSPNWNVGRGCCSRDVGWANDGGQLYLDNDYAVMTGPADYTACSEETGYTSGPLERGTLTPDENICLRTNGNRYALVTIVSASDQALQFRATVWDPPIS